jgi:hypothetical protein
VARSAFDALDVTHEYTRTGDLDLQFLRSGSPVADFDGFSINIFNLGAFTALDELETVTDEIGAYHCRLGEGHYWIIAGTRDLTGSSFVCIVPVNIHSGTPARLAVDLTPSLYVSSVSDSMSTSMDVPLFAITDVNGQVRSSREAIGRKPLLLVLLRPNHEPSTRMAELVRSWLVKSGEKAPAALWVIEGEKGSAVIENPAYDPEGKIGQLFGLKSPDDLPLVLWVGKDGKIALTSKGYNLNIAVMLDDGNDK